MLTTLTVFFLCAADPVAVDDLREDVEQKHVDLSSAPGRLSGALVGSVIGAAATLAVGAATFALLWVGTGAQLNLFSSGGPNDGAGIAVIGSLAAYGLGAVLLTPLGTWLGHQLGGGEGNYGSAAAGGLCGLAAGAGLLLAGITAANNGSPEGSYLLLALAAGATIAGPIIGVELSHRSNVLPKVGLAPTKNGGSLSLAWEI